MHIYDSIAEVSTVGPGSQVLSKCNRRSNDGGADDKELKRQTVTVTGFIRVVAPKEVPMVGKVAILGHAPLMTTRTISHVASGCLAFGGVIRSA